MGVTRSLSQQGSPKLQIFFVDLRSRSPTPLRHRVFGVFNPRPNKEPSKGRFFFLVAGWS